MKPSRKPGCNRLLAVSFLLIVSTFLSTVFLFSLLNHGCSDSNASAAVNFLIPRVSKGESYDRRSPLIFVGGWPRSGTTLMRVMLDAHPEVRCGEETHVIPDILTRMTAHMNRSATSMRLMEAGITDEVLLSATAAFVLEVIVGHAEPAPRLCNKDPFTAAFALHLSAMFPAAQFLLMVRDGRAVCHSIASRNIGIGQLDHKNLTSCLKIWSQSLEKMHYQCRILGSAKCLPVYYEKLVLHPKSVLRKVMEFLNVPWNDAVLNHQDHINKPGGISLSRIEPSTDQVIKPVNLEALTKWANFIPEDVRRNIRELAPMLERLGYDPDAYPPNYGNADDDVIENTLLVQKNAEFFKRLAWEARNKSKISVE